MSDRTKKIKNLLDEITDGLQWAPRADRLRAMEALHIPGNVARQDAIELDSRDDQLAARGSLTEEPK